MGFFDEAVIAVDTSLPDGHPAWPIVADTFCVGGYTIWYTVHEPLAEHFWGKTLEIQQRELPANHPDIASSVNLMVGILNKQGKHQESEALLRDSLQALHQVHRDGSLAISMGEGMLGLTLALQGKFEEAEKNLLKSHKNIVATINDETNWLILESLVRVLTLYEEWQRPEPAESHGPSH